MKVRRREFIEVLGASVASVSFPGLHAAGRAESENESIEKGGWRLQVTPAGEIVSFTDGKLELLNHRLGDNRPQCKLPPVARGKRRNGRRGSLPWKSARQTSSWPRRG